MKDSITLENGSSREMTHDLIGAVQFNFVIIYDHIYMVTPHSREVYQE